MKTSFSDLQARNILSKPELQQVKGGALGAQNNFWNIKSGSCGFFVNTGDNFIVMCNISKADALSSVADANGHGYWCCDSCATTSYCGGNK